MPTHASQAFTSCTAISGSMIQQQSADAAHRQLLLLAGLQAAIDPGQLAVACLGQHLCGCQRPAQAAMLLSEPGSSSV